MLRIRSDAAQGLLSFLREKLAWVHLQRCVWHFWRSLAGEMASAVAQVAESADAAHTRREQVREELKGLLHAVIDAASFTAAEEALLRQESVPLRSAPGAEGE